MTDVSDARFYVIDEEIGDLTDVAPVEFGSAFPKAHALNESGHGIKMFYTDEAPQICITRFVSDGIPPELVSGA
jgi:hypothetical protein